MLPTAGFIPPPVLPLVPGANGIVATGGLLAGVGAGAFTGAKAGSFFGPKGALIGAVAGGLLLPLLLPDPLNPGVVPGLDPGLNPGESPDKQVGVYPDTGDEYWQPKGTPTVPGTYYQYVFKYSPRTNRSQTIRCDDGSVQYPGGEGPYYSSEFFEEAVYAYSIRFKFTPLQVTVLCGPSAPSTNDYAVRMELMQADGSWKHQNLAWTYMESGSFTYPTWSYTATNAVELWEIAQSGEPLSLEGLLPEPEPAPRPSPVPFTPLPEPDREPAIVPIPDPEPQPEPLEIPSPDNPDAPPITIPQAPPAPPQEVPDPDRDLPPGPYPITPEPVLPPLPVPGVPTIPEPSPDPNLVPAPSPSLPPLPGPIPLPSPDPETDPGTGEEPAAVPTPVPPGTPAPGPIVTPISPEDPQAVDPGTGIVPQPIPLPTTTPPSHHFPVSGDPAVTPGGTRPDVAAIADEVGRIEQKVARIQRNGALGGLADLLWLLPLLADFLEGDIPGTNYQLQGVCEDVQEGESQPIANFLVADAKNLGAVINRLDVMQDLFQQHLEWRTPICRDKPASGDFRTITFISDELSPGGKRRLDRRFRYRSQSGLGLDGVVNHWKSFVWQSGPVLVKHTGAWWGTPRVWASSIAEGKRVLRHAAAEAGLDPDQAGRWEISGTSNTRIGAPGTLRVNTSGGYWWITARDGSDERPLVVTSPPES